MASGAQKLPRHTAAIPATAATETATGTHRRGKPVALAATARAARVPMIMSGSSLIHMEDVIPHNPDAWFQAYLPAEPDRLHRIPVGPTP